MPEIAELDIAISDVKLSQIYDWIVPDNTLRWRKIPRKKLLHVWAVYWILLFLIFRFGKVKRSLKAGYEKLPDDSDQKWSNKKYNANLNSVSPEYSLDSDKRNTACKLKYQQASIDVSCREICIDEKWCMKYGLVVQMKG